MPLIQRWLFVLVAACCVLAPLAASPPAEAREEINRECLCEGAFGACQHFLRNPKGATDDPCWCNKCRLVSEHDGATLPANTNAHCFASKREDCYLKRHAVAWQITCSECVQNDECCKYDNHQFCPDCQDGTDDPFATDVFGRPGRETVLDRLEKEQRHFKKPKDVVVLYNRHFYFVTDVKPMKVKMPGGSARLASRHEWAHLMMERAEYARREFVDHFGSSPSNPKPTAIYIPAKERDAGKVQAAYMGSPRTNILYGGSNDRGMSDGFCFNGFCNSEQKFGGDHDSHMAMRHSLGHVLVSCWTVVDGNNRALPRWLFVGAAHWLSKLQPRFRDDVTFCGNESTPISGSGKDWDKDVARLAAGNRLTSIEELFGKTSGNQLDLDDHKRSWSYLHVALAEWREPFVKVLADIRRQQEVRDTFMKNLECTPEIFDERWRERVTGRRRSLAPGVREEGEVAENDSPGARERRAIRSETEWSALAARVRGLGTIEEPRTVEVVIDLFGKNSELVRETAMVALLKTKSAEVQERIWQYGLHHKSAMSRAYTARACGALGLEYALPKLREQLEDSNWYARAEAAVACGKLADVNSMSKLRDMVNDSAEKARVAAMDALAMFGEDAEMGVPLIAKHLKSSQWQLRVAACQSLGKIGSMEAVDPLIDRMEVESGRLRRDIQLALKEITRDDLGRKPEHWRNWWDRLKANNPGSGLPRRPDAPPETGVPDKPDPDDRYAKQEYYGIEIYSSRIGFVLDTSGSMASLFEPSSRMSASLSRKYTGKNKITICKEEIAQSLQSLDPRSHFNIISFNTGIRTFKKNPVPASGGNVKSAFGFLRGLPATGETNYYDALRAALDLGDGPDASPNFRSTPDTLTFLTDGKPTRGEMTDADTLLEWYTALNRYARIRTHVIAFGTKGVDVVLLRGMAERNDGRFIHVVEQ